MTETALMQLPSDHLDALADFILGRHEDSFLAR